MSDEIQTPATAAAPAVAPIDPGTIQTVEQWLEAFAVLGLSVASVAFPGAAAVPIAIRLLPELEALAQAGARLLDGQEASEADLAAANADVDAGFAQAKADLARIRAAASGATADAPTG